MSVLRCRVCLVSAIATLCLFLAGCTQQSAAPDSAMAAGASEEVSTEMPTARDEEPAEPVTTERMAAVAPEEKPRPAPRTPTYVTRNVAAGTQFEVELMEPLSSGTNSVGDPVLGRLVDALYVDGTRVAPAGAEVHGTVTEVVPLKKFGGQPKISVMFESLTVDDGSRVPILASHTAAGQKQAGRDAAKIGGGAAAGAIIGHQVDDDKGKEIGALIGGAIGTAVAAKTGKEVELTAGTALLVSVEDDVQVRLATR